MLGGLGLGGLGGGGFLLLLKTPSSLSWMMGRRRRLREGWLWNSRC